MPRKKKVSKKRTVKKKPVKKVPRKKPALRRVNTFDVFLQPPVQSKKAKSAALLKRFFRMRSGHKLTPLTIAKKMGMSEVWANGAEAELRRAAKQGFTDINEYIDKDRPCKAGNKVIKK
jgi:hypothetical protein